ncbi:MAG: hypothetical protein WAV98_01335 [Minisyncoccia bacterium]
MIIEVDEYKKRDDTDKLSYIKLRMSKGRKVMARSLVAAAQSMDKIATENGIEINANYGNI